MGVQEKLFAKYVCKVRKAKNKHDDRMHLCGSGLLRDRKGEYFLIPASYADYISKIFPQYEVGDPYLPKEKVQAPARGADEKEE